MKASGHYSLPVVRTVLFISIIGLLSPYATLVWKPARAFQIDGDRESPNKNLPDLDVERFLDPPSPQAADSIPGLLAGWSPYDGNLNYAPAPSSISITSPSNGQTFNEGTSVTISASAQPPSGSSIAVVSFYANGSFLSNKKASPYSISWSNFTGGQYALTAVAQYTNGTTATSAAVNITVIGSNPSVTVTSPANGTQASAPATINVTAAATAPPGRTVNRVDFYYNGTNFIGSDTSSPYGFVWSAVSAGSYLITAKVTDSTGAQAISSAIQITVTSALPTVSIYSPSNGATFTAPANIPISANASASTGRTITKVDFYYGGTSLIGTSLGPSYSVTWNNVPVGAHQLTAVATDSVGATNISTTVGITVSAGLPPTVNITAPLNQTSYQPPATVAINANASASAGRTITKVEFFNGGNLIGTAMSSPYGCVWLNVGSGTYTLTAKATDSMGSTAVSAQVTIYVTAPTPPPAGDNFSTARLDPINRTGFPGEDLFSRNFNWSLPILSLPGRSGLDLEMALSYNSLVWTRDGSQIKFNADSGFPGPGFRLGFPMIQEKYFNSQIGSGVSAYLMVTSSGSRVEFRQVGSTTTYESGDSSYAQLIEIGVDNLLVRTADGTQLTYWKTNVEYRCTEIKDRNGNYISAGYNSSGQISTIMDSLGRVINFEYDGFGNLTALWQLWGGARHNWATFGYTNLQYQTNFPGLTVLGPQSGQVLSVLQQVSLADGSRFNFTYNSWGQVYLISNYGSNGQLLNHVRYDLPINAIIPQSDCPRFSNRGDFALNWNGNAEANTQFSFEADHSCGQLTAPDGTISKTFFPTSGVQKGLPTLSEIWLGVVKKKWTTITWAQDSGVTTYVQNPRVIETNTYDDSGNRRRLTTSYTTVNLPSGKPCSVPSDSYEYSNDGTVVLRRSHTDYDLGTTYITSSRRIIGLVKFQFLYDGDPGSIMSKVEYVYDDASLLQATASAPLQHDEVSFGAAFVSGRGNLSRIRRYDVILGGYAESQIGANTAGSTIFTRDPLSHQINIGYLDSFASTGTPITGATFAYPTTVTDPDNYSSSIQYDYDHGGARLRQDPKGAIQTATFDTAGRVIRTDISNSAYVRFIYPNASSTAQSITSYSVQQAGSELYSSKIFDGAGRVIAAASDFPGSTGGYRGVYTTYDNVGRESARSNPTEITNTWIPAGDDSSTGWLYTLQTYDWNGRPRITTNTDQSAREVTYGGCGCAGGEVVTISDEVSRRQRMSYDVLGRLIKTESLNFDQTVYATQTNTYNARDQITSTLVRQGINGAGQETLLTYDGHGRLATRKAPIEDSPTLYSYYSDDLPLKVTDPRGASATNTFNGRHMLTSTTYAKPANAPESDTGPYAVPKTPTVAFGYDGSGNRLWMTDGLGRVDYVYDTWSRLTSETRIFNDFPNSNYPLTYAYNLAGKVTTITDPFGKTITYGYDQAGQLTGITGTNFAGVTQYASALQYRASGALKHLTSGDGRNVDIGYNSRLQISSFNASNNISHSNYEYDADNRVNFVHNLVNPSFDRKYSYDHLGRLKEVFSGTDARGESYNPDNPNPFKETYTYDIWSNLLTRSNRWWTEDQGTFTASYANSRNSAWGYDAAGHVKNNGQGQYTYDTAGRMTKFDSTNTIHIDQRYDGDGQPTYRLETHPGLTAQATIYYVRSHMMGGQPITELKADGFKRRTYVYADSEEVARQEKGSPDSVSWISRDPVTGDDSLFRRDPLGGYVGSEFDALAPDYATLKGDAPTHDTDGDPFDLGSGCTLDGIAIDCNVFASMVNNGAVSVRSGGKLVGDVNHVGFGGVWVTRPVQIGPPDDPYTVDREDWVITPTVRVLGVKFKKVVFPSLPQRTSDTWNEAIGRVTDRYQKCREKAFGNASTFGGLPIVNQNVAIHSLVAGFLDAKVSAMVTAIWAIESQFSWDLSELADGRPLDHGPMQLTAWWKNNHPELISGPGAYDSFSRPEGSPNRKRPFTGDPTDNINTGGNIIWAEYYGEYRNWSKIPGAYKGTSTKGLTQSDYTRRAMPFFDAYRVFYKCLKKND